MHLIKGKHEKKYINRNPKIFILSGKAKSGKNYVADIISDYYKDSIQISYAYYLKQYVKKISNWDGREETDRIPEYCEEL